MAEEGMDTLWRSVVLQGFTGGTNDDGRLVSLNISIATDTEDGSCWLRVADAEDDRPIVTMEVPMGEALQMGLASAMAASRFHDLHYGPPQGVKVTKAPTTAVYPYPLTTYMQDN